MIYLVPCALGGGDAGNLILIGRLPHILFVVKVIIIRVVHRQSDGFQAESCVRTVLQTADESNLDHGLALWVARPVFLFQVVFPGIIEGCSFAFFLRKGP